MDEINPPKVEEIKPPRRGRRKRNNPEQCTTNDEIDQKQITQDKVSHSKVTKNYAVAPAASSGVVGQRKRQKKR